MRWGQAEYDFIFSSIFEQLGKSLVSDGDQIRFVIGQLLI